MNAEPCEFRFIADTKLRERLQSNYRSSRRAFDKVCYPWTVILVGKSMEAILLDGLNANGVKAAASPKAPKGNSDVDTWSLAELIAVSADLGLVPPDFDQLPHSVSHWRDVVRGAFPNIGIEAWKEEARVAIEVLRKIDRWLS